MPAPSSACANQLATLSIAPLALEAALAALRVRVLRLADELRLFPERRSPQHNDKCFISAINFEEDGNYQRFFMVVS